LEENVFKVTVPSWILARKKKEEKENKKGKGKSSWQNPFL